MALLDRDRLVSIGFVVATHGMRGEVKVEALTDTPDYYQSLRAVFLDDRNGLRERPIKAMRPNPMGWIIHFAAVDSRETATELKGGKLLLEPERLKPLESGEYFVDDLVGCRVETLAGICLGTVREVLETGANKVLWVDDGEGTLPVPMTAGVLVAVDTAQRLIRVDPPPGLLELKS